MSFVKLDTRILDSSLWLDKDCRDVFITALLMAEPKEFTAPQAQLEVLDLKETGYQVEPGWYGFVPASGSSIVHRAQIDRLAGIEALKRLGSPEAESRSAIYGGRRLVRVDGGYVMLNYIKYREKDHTAAERMKRYRECRNDKSLIPVEGASNVTPVHRNVTDEDADAYEEVLKNKSVSVEAGPTLFLEAEKIPQATVAITEEAVEQIYQAYPRKEAPGNARKAIRKALAGLRRRPRTSQAVEMWLLERVRLYGAKLRGSDKELIPHPATWFNRESYDEDPTEWYPRKKSRGFGEEPDEPEPANAPRGRGWKTGDEVAKEKAAILARIAREEANG